MDGVSIRLSEYSSSFKFVSRLEVELPSLDLIPLVEPVAELGIVILLNLAEFEQRGCRVHEMSQSMVPISLCKDLLRGFIGLPLNPGSFSGIAEWHNISTALSCKTSSRRLCRDIKSAIGAICCEVNRSYNNDGGRRR